MRRLKSIEELFVIKQQFGTAGIEPALYALYPGTHVLTSSKLYSDMYQQGSCGVALVWSVL